MDRNINNLCMLAPAYKVTSYDSDLKQINKAPQTHIVDIPAIPYCPAI